MGIKMKKILIVGENSYIGRSFENFAKDKYEINIISSRNGLWRSVDFTGYDSILYCAGIAHVKQKKRMQSLYYKINCDLTVEIFSKTQNSGVKQFIFLSSAAVLTEAKRNDFYGGSKLKAEQELQKSVDGGGLNLCIVRPPMVYGKGCKGNFPKLVKLAKIMPVFPDYPNKRSMIYIINLCNFLCGLIDNNSAGIFQPQNKEYINTTELVRLIARSHGKNILTTKLFNPIISLFKNHVNALNKMFGNLTYEKTGYEEEYNIVEFEDSLK